MTMNMTAVTIQGVPTNTDSIAFSRTRIQWVMPSNIQP